MMFFDHSLDADLLERLARDGPINVAVTYREYSEHLLPLAKRSWQQPNHWDQRERQRVLLFFRGYSFFRQLGENEREFWSNLHRELSYEGNVTNPHRDELEKALKADPRIRDMFIESFRREFVQTIDAIWGIRSLNAHSLEKLFRRYYFQTKALDVNPELIRELLRGEDSVTIERAVRQSSSYDRIFRGLRDAIEFIQHTNIDPEPLWELSERLAEAGHVLSEPNPIEFFRHKAERALRHLLLNLSGATQVTARRTRSIETAIVEEDDDDQTAHQPSRRQARKAFPVNVRLAPSTYEFDERVELQFAQLPQGVRVLRLSGATERELSLSTNHASFVIAPGQTRAQVFVDGEPATRAITLYGLPPLEWRFYNQCGERLRRRPLEGQRLVVEVRLEDGTYARAHWWARWDALGERAEPYSLQLEVDGYRIEAELSCEPHAVRFFDDDHMPVDVVRQHAVYCLALPPSTVAEQRALYASDSNQIITLAGEELFPQLDQLQPVSSDELIIERNVNGVFEPVGRIPVLLPPIWHLCSLHGTRIKLHATAAADAKWHIAEGTLAPRSHPVDRHSQSIPLQQALHIAKRTITVTLENGEVRLERHVTYTPDWAALLEAELQSGLGWSPLVAGSAGGLPL